METALAPTPTIECCRELKEEIEFTKAGLKIRGDLVALGQKEQQLFKRIWTVFDAIINEDTPEDAIIYCILRKRIEKLCEAPRFFGPMLIKAQDQGKLEPNLITETQDLLNKLGAHCPCLNASS